MKYLNFKNILIGYAILLSLVIAVSLVIGALKMGQSSTIVVDASKYIKEQLKSSQEQNLRLDSQYNILFENLARRDQEIEALKLTLSSRNKLIDHLKIKLHEVPVTIDYTDAQQDSIFSNGLN